MDKIVIVDRWDNGAELAVESCERMIVDHPTRGRLYLVQMRPNVVEPGSYRCGVVCQLLPGDTRAALDAAHNEITTIEQAMQMGYRDDRPLLPWDGYAIQAVADKAKKDADAEGAGIGSQL